MKEVGGGSYYSFLTCICEAQACYNSGLLYAQRTDFECYSYRVEIDWTRENFRPPLKLGSCGPLLAWQ